jgi:hypothetical protein
LGADGAESAGSERRYAVAPVCRRN